MKKKLILLIVTLVLGTISITACGSDPITEEAKMGKNLEDKAKEQVENHQENAGSADEYLENNED